MSDSDAELNRHDELSDLQNAVRHASERERASGFRDARPRSHERCRIRLDAACMTAAVREALN
jgi:hypothetical protein